MNKSETIGKLAEALSKAQGTMRGSIRDSMNPFFKSKYSDLASVWDACREPLSANGLSVVQVPEFRDGRVIVSTLLLHSSGEWISGDLEMAPVKADPQGVGSAITYARRYGLSAFAGIAPEDDDGNAASMGGKPPVGRITEPTPLKKKEPESGTLNKEQGGNATSKGQNPPAVPEPLPDVLPRAVADDLIAATLAEATASMAPKEGTVPDGCIPPGQCANFYANFRDHLKVSIRKQSDALAKDWLKQQGIVDSLGEPTARAIRKENYFDVREQSEAHARSL